jgi:hypothetical protein
MPTFNQLDSQVLESALQQAGFNRTVVGAEVVYERSNHQEPRLVVRVYTTIPTNPNTSDKVRAKGVDAIRTCLVFREKAKTWGLKASPKVLRTGAPAAIVSRTLDRARAMYAKANEMAKAPTCKVCGATTYPDSGRCVRAKDHIDFAHDQQFGHSVAKGEWKAIIQSGEVHHPVPQEASPVVPPVPVFVPVQVPTPSRKDRVGAKVSWTTSAGKISGIVYRADAKHMWVRATDGTAWKLPVTMTPE